VRVVYFSGISGYLTEIPDLRRSVNKPREPKTESHRQTFCQARRRAPDHRRRLRRSSPSSRGSLRVPVMCPNSRCQWILPQIHAEGILRRHVCTMVLSSKMATVDTSFHARWCRPAEFRPHSAQESYSDVHKRWQLESETSEGQSRALEIARFNIQRSNRNQRESHRTASK
jgi:hypothetical protein